MKRYITYCMVLFAVLFASCTETTEGLDSVEALIVSTEKIEMDCQGGKTSIDIDAYCSWTVSSTEGWSWITTTAKNGNSGKKSIKLTLAENTTVNVRTATITIENELYGLSHKISVLQEAGAPYINLSRKSIETSPDGTESSFNVESNIDYTITASQNWCKVDKSLGESGRETFKVTIAKSGDTNKRTATIKVVNKKHGITQEITVNQSALEPSLEVSDTAISTTIAGGTKSVTVTSNISWNATCEADWVTITPVNGASGTKTINVTIAANATTSARTATIKVINSEYDIIKEIAVNQVALEPTLEVSDIAISATTEGVTKSITVTSNISWNATCEADWVTITPVNGASGTKTLNVAIAANETTSSRNATVKVVNSEYDITKEIAISQVAFEPVLSIQGNSSLSVDFKESNKLIEVNSNIDYQISTNVEWIVINKVAEGINVVYSTNSTEEVRRGEVVLYNEQYELRKVINIVQAAFPASNTIRYTSVNNVAVIPYNTSAFGANIISITNENGVGLIKLDAPATTIGSQAFYGCSSLTSIIIPNTVTTIGSSAFYGCTSLESITIPQNITSIGSQAFYNCTGELIINSTTLVETNYSSSSYPAYNSSYWLYGNKFTKLIVGNNITKIGSYAFRACSYLTSVTLPEGITSIGSYSFYGCSTLTSVVIPSTVSSINTYAFYNCSSLASVYCASTTPPSLGSYAFTNNASSRKIYVQVGLLSSYQSAWSSYSSSISEVAYTPTECTSLTITADDVNWNETTTTIYYTAVTNGTSMFGNVTGKTVTGTAQSASFSQNTSTTSTVQRTISYTYMGKTATTTITQGIYNPKSYTVNLNSQWRLSSSVSNPNSSTYDGVYESNSNYGVNSSSAWMYINIEGYDTFSIYVRSNAESGYDYVTVYNLDSTSSSKMTTMNSQSSGTSISSYTKVTFSNIGGGSHRIAIKYSKDSSQSSGTDRGYVLIPKNQ